jgi:ArsR family transcriptional regulator, arsenate/arsenite/antimonite-responsive transcriptional repressor
MKTAPPIPQVDEVFRAFSDRTRLRIMNLLHKRGGRKELCVCDIIRVLDLPQAKVSRHLAYLRRSGLVSARREGQWMHYRLTKPQGSFHAKMLGCLRCCMAEVPQLQNDLARLDKQSPASPDGGVCCG